MLSLDELGVLLGDLIVTCLAGAPAGGVVADAGAKAEVGVTGGEAKEDEGGVEDEGVVGAEGGDVSALRRGDLLACCGVVGCETCPLEDGGELDSSSSGNCSGGIFNPFVSSACIYYISVTEVNLRQKMRRTCK